MPDPVTNPAAPVPVVFPTPPPQPANTADWMSEIPGGDIPWDDLFADPGQPTPATPPVAAQPPATPATPQAPPATAAPATPVTPPTTDDFLKAGKTVYKSREEAERGLAYKDEVIERLRNVEIQRTGIDPLTGKPVPPTPQGPVRYTQNPKQYMDDIVSAVSKQSPDDYLKVQQKLVYDTLEPVAPIILSFAKNQAVESASHELNAELVARSGDPTKATSVDMGGFLKSKEYERALELVPDLKAAIAYGEGDLNFSPRLPQLYKTAFYIAQGLKTQELVQQVVTPVAAPQNPIPARPTTAPASAPLPAPSTAPSLENSAGRQAIKAAMEARGVDKMIW